MENPGRHETRGPIGSREGEPGKKYFLRLFCRDREKMAQFEVMVECQDAPFFGKSPLVILGGRGKNSQLPLHHSVIFL